MPCDACRSIDWNQLAEGKKHDHCSHFRVVRQKAKDGCNLCSRIVQKYNIETKTDRFPSEHTHGSFRTVLSFDEDPHDDENRLWRLKVALIPSRKSTQRTIHFSLPVFLDHDSQKILGDRFVGRACNHSLTNSFEPTRTQELLAKCVQEHLYQCKPRSEPLSKLPTRLVDCGLPGTATPPTLLLSKPESEGEWASLSHCWGLPPWFRTLKDDLKENLIDNTISIDPDKLPATFRDAIAVCRGLGIQYLWIDSLCIIQDDQDDLDRELERMDEYYSNAYVTIAVEMATSDTEGFLNSLTQHRNSQDPRTAKHDGPLKVCVSIRGKPSSIYIDIVEPESNFDWDESALGKRAWTLQEVVLSPRILHFTKHQVIFGCRSGLIPESFDRQFQPTSNQLIARREEYRYEGKALPSRGPFDDVNAMPNIGSSNDSQRREPTSGWMAWEELHSKQSAADIEMANRRLEPSQRHQRQLTLSEMAFPPMDFGNESLLSKGSLFSKTDLLLGRWYQLLDDYRCRNITKLSDRVPAISAIARNLEQTLEMVYYAGVWVNDAFRSLAWTTYGAGRTIAFTSGSRQQHVPSWSWASLEYIDGQKPASADMEIRRKMLDRKGDDLPAYLQAVVVEDSEIQSRTDRFTFFKRQCGIKVTAYILHYRNWRRSPPPFINNLTEHKFRLRGTRRTSTPADRELVCEFDCPSESGERSVKDLHGLTLLQLGVWELEGKNVSIALLLKEAGEPDTFRRVGIAEVVGWKELSNEMNRKTVTLI